MRKELKQQGTEYYEYKLEAIIFEYDLEKRGELLSRGKGSRAARKQRTGHKGLLCLRHKRLCRKDNHR